MSAIRSVTISFLVFVLIAFLSCGKKKESYATIVCKDVTGNGIDSVVVELYSHVKKTDGSAVAESFVASGLTNSIGKVSFGFRVPAMYTFRASKGAKLAAGTILMQEGKEVQSDIILQ